MPIYEYRCQECGHVFEELVLREDDAPDACPKCSKGEVDRLISTTNFQLKGSGWYVTDYASKPAAGAASSTSGEKSAESAEGGTSGEKSADSADAGTSGDKSAESSGVGTSGSSGTAGDEVA